MTIDHKPHLAREIKYIRSVDGYVSLEKRVNGILAVSRAMGDFAHYPQVCCEPDLYAMPIKRWKGIYYDEINNSVVSQ